MSGRPWSDPEEPWRIVSLSRAIRETLDAYCAAHRDMPIEARWGEREILALHRLTGESYEDRLRQQAAQLLALADAVPAHERNDVFDPSDVLRHNAAELLMRASAMEQSG